MKLIDYMTKGLMTLALHIFRLLTIRIYSCKSKCTTRNKKISITAAKSSPFYYAIANQPKNSDFFIFVFLTKNVRSYKNKCINTKNNNNIQKKTLYISISSSVDAAKIVTKL